MSISEFFRKVQFFVMLALGTYPACACIIIFIEPALLAYMWLFPVTYGLLGLVSFALPGKLRFPLGLLGAILFVAPCVLCFDGNARNALLSFALGYGLMLLWSVRIPGWDATQELPGGWLGGCFTVLLFGYLLSSIELRLASVALGIKASLFVFVFLAMLSLNRGSLVLAAGGRRGFSTAMRRKNVLLTVGMFAIALVPAMIPSLVNLVKLLIGLMAQLAEKLAEMMPKETVAETTAPPTTAPATGEGLAGLFEGLQPQHTPQAVYILMTVIVLGVALPVMGYAFFKMGRAMWRLLSRLATDMVTAANTQEDDFVDEITDTREDAESEYYRETGEKKRQFILDTGKLTPTEQIRHRYRYLSAKHPEWKAHTTARENLPEEAAQLYERARYSEHPITPRDAESFKEKAK